MKKTPTTPLSKNDLKYIFKILDSLSKEHDNKLKVMPEEPTDQSHAYHFRNGYFKGETEGAVEMIQTIKTILYLQVQNRPYKKKKEVSLFSSIGKGIGYLLYPVKRLIDLYPNRDNLGRFTKEK